MRRLFWVIVLWFWLTLLTTGVLFTLLLIRNGMPRHALPLHAHDFSVFAVAGAGFCYFISRYLTKPLHSLGGAAASIAEGRLDTRVEPRLKKRRDEIADLACNFDRMAERIDVLVSGQRRLLGDVSHELRSPLSRLIVALGLAKAGVKEGRAGETEESLERIGWEAQRLDTLIGQLLALTRIDSGVDRGSPARFDLTTLAQEVASDGDFEARARHRTVSVTQADACSISGFEEVLRSAVENVVRNAIRHTEEDTTVEISLVCGGGRARINVRDHGGGVPENMLADIFLPFRRVENGKSDGAGLGLAIARRAVEVHRGTIRASNAQGGGLRIEIEIPLG